ncbi:hypothetical protein R3P38DRAFT_1034599 [Favolaschia claudopus]|uniref:Uncharacterized protein n=1 Tax=Favolaschia claudopus TaxID=2862362 RepID=A0AAW0BIE2_9AGAR
MKNWKIYLSRGACEEAYRKRVGGGLVFSLQWHVSRHKYELIPLQNGTRDFLFCISFIPYWRKAEDGDAIYRRLCTLSEEDKAKWYDIYGKHAGIALDELEIQTICYPTNCAIAQWIPSTVARVIIENKDELRCLVEPVPTLREAIAEFAAIMRA